MFPNNYHFSKCQVFQIPFVLTDILKLCIKDVIKTTTTKSLIKQPFAVGCRPQFKYAFYVLFKTGVFQV